MLDQGGTTFLDQLLQQIKINKDVPYESKKWGEAALRKSNQLFFLENVAKEIIFDDHPLSENKYLNISLSNKFDEKSFPMHDEEPKVVM